MGTRHLQPFPGAALKRTLNAALPSPPGGIGEAAQPDRDADQGGPVHSAAGALKLCAPGRGGAAPGGPRCPEEMSLGPTSHVSLQSYTEWLQELREKGPELLQQPPASTEPSSVSTAADTPLTGPPLSLLLAPGPGRGGCPELCPWAVGRNLCVWLTRALFCPQDLASKLREAEETQNNLQAECDQYRTILAETVGLLRGSLGAAGKEFTEPAGRRPWEESPGFTRWLCVTFGKSRPLPGPHFSG